jgi:hypothetical protein
MDFLSGCSHYRSFGRPIGAYLRFPAETGSFKATPRRHVWNSERQYLRLMLKNNVQLRLYFKELVIMKTSNLFTIRCSLVLLGAIGLAGIAQATPYNFTSANGSSKWINVDYWTGSGSSETILIVDWENAGNWVSKSHAFGYRWDGSPTTEATMLADIDAGGALDITTGYGGAFIYNLYYNDADGDHHQHTEEGSWNPGSTNDVNAVWGDMSSDWTKLGDWDANQMGIDNEYIANGQLEGFNAIWWYTSKPNLNLTVPVPEPTSLAILMAAGTMGMIRRRRSHSLPTWTQDSPANSTGGKPAKMAILLVCLTAMMTANEASASYVYNPNDFAVEVVSSTGLQGTGLYNDPQAILGRPTLTFANTWSGGGTHRVKLVEAAYNTTPEGSKVITTLANNTQITVRMGRKVYNDPNNPYGIDLLVYGNSFFSGSSGSVDENTNLNTFTLGGIFAEPVKVSVSPDGINWYRYDSGPYADGMFPTNSYKWDRTNAKWTDEETDPTKPVNPALTMAGFNGKTAADGLDLYRSTIYGITFDSAGGTGFDLTESGFDWIQYVKVEGVTGFANGEIDAIAAVTPVPEPVTIGLLTMGILGFIEKRRRS